MSGKGFGAETIYSAVAKALGSPGRPLTYDSKVLLVGVLPRVIHNELARLARRGSFTAIQ
jgi:hypothetical protein